MQKYLHKKYINLCKTIIFVVNKQETEKTFFFCPEAPQRSYWLKH